MSKEQPQLNKLDSIQIQSPTKIPSMESSKKKSSKSQTKLNLHPLHNPWSVKQNQENKKQQVSLNTHTNNSNNNSLTNSTTNAHSLYEQTYYLTGLRQNYLVLISDNMHIIQLPVGLLKSDIMIGDPIKLKLEFDTKRAAADQRKFVSMQENLIKQFEKD